MHIALYQPDIAQNAGTILRFCACLDVDAHIIEPAGFAASDRTMRRAGMDYLDHVRLHRHLSWTAFLEWRRSEVPGARLLLLTTRSDTPYFTFSYEESDILLLGRESAGVPPEVHAAADARLSVPMRSGMRSLNVAVAAAMVAGEALRQARWAVDPGPGARVTHQP